MARGEGVVIAPIKLAASYRHAASLPGLTGSTSGFEDHKATPEV
jgi:hypothetical protein